MLIRIALSLVGLVLLAHGGEGLYHTFTSRTQAHVTCQDAQSQRPATAWLRVTGCEVDYVRAAYRQKGGRITEMFFPLRPAGAPPGQPASIVLATKDPEVLAIAEQTIGGNRQTDQETFLVMMLRIVTTLKAAREVQGLARSPLEMLRTRRDLVAIKAPLADGFTVIDAGREPYLLYPALEVTAGAHALLVLAFIMAGRAPKKRVEAEPPATEPPPETTIRFVDRPFEPNALEFPSEPVVEEEPITLPAEAFQPMPPKAAAPELRRLMLLNLPADAGTASIEDAPPLGAREDVRRALVEALPGIRFDDDGHGEFNRPDHQVRIDVGRDAQVWTAVVDVTGDRAPVALSRLLTQTGWRAFAPKLGRFLADADLG